MIGETRTSFGRFIQPYSIIPDLANSQAWNRFSYSYNNPLKYTDPSGHAVMDVYTGPCMDGAVCGVLRTGKSVEAAKLSGFGIKVFGATLDEKIRSLQAARLAGQKFTSLTNNGMSAQEAFH